jgi:hypothetical protein
MPDAVLCHWCPRIFTVQADVFGKYHDRRRRFYHQSERWLR